MSVYCCICHSGCWVGYDQHSAPCRSLVWDGEWNLDVVMECVRLAAQGMPAKLCLTVSGKVRPDKCPLICRSSAPLFRSSAPLFHPLRRSSALCAAPLLPTPLRRPLLRPLFRSSALSLCRSIKV